MSLLIDLDQQASEQVKSENLTVEEQLSMLKYGGEHQLYLLDDIVFHIVSLFDYIGNFVGLVFYDDQRAKLKWKGVVKFCKNADIERTKTGYERINKSFVSPLIQKHEQSLVHRLEEYRASLFHYRKDFANTKITLDLISTHRNEFVVPAPEDLLNWIKQLSLKSESEEVKLLNAAFWLVDQALFAVKEILPAVEKDLQLIADQLVNKNND